MSGRMSAALRPDMHLALPHDETFSTTMRI
jgi:hypothetical protein